MLFAKTAVWAKPLAGLSSIGIILSFSGYKSKNLPIDSLAKISKTLFPNL